MSWVSRSDHATLNCLRLNDSSPATEELTSCSVIPVKKAETVILASFSSNPAALLGVPRDSKHFLIRHDFLV